MLSKKANILVVDDDIRILRMVQRILELEDYQVLTAGNGDAALDTVGQNNIDLVLLDVMMPGMDWYTVCRRIREFSQVPIMIVTAKSNDEEKVEGLDAGADDYITKPFSAKELVARVKAILRRSRLQYEQNQPAFCCQDLTVDFARNIVTLKGNELNLTATEYRLLSYLARNASCIVTPDQILESVWGEEYAGEPHLLQINTARLRQKLEDEARNPRYIITRPGIGYMMPKQD